MACWGEPSVVRDQARANDGGQDSLALQRCAAPDVLGTSDGAEHRCLAQGEVSCYHYRRRETLSDSHRSRAEAGSQPREHEVDKNLLNQQALNAILRISLELVSLAEQMHRVLDRRSVTSPGTSL